MSYGLFDDYESDSGLRKAKMQRESETLIYPNPTADIVNIQIPDLE